MIYIAHTNLGPDVTVVGDDLWKQPAMYYAGLEPAQYPVPALRYSVDIDCESVTIFNFTHLIIADEWWGD